MRNNQMTNYIMPTSADLPPIHVHFEETPSIHGALAAKGIGELPMDGPAPAILNAIEHATGIAFNEIPLLPEDVFERMTATPASGSETSTQSTSKPAPKQPRFLHEVARHRRSFCRLHRRSADLSDVSADA